MHLIYALSERAMYKLSEAGFALLKSDAKNSLWVFLNDGMIPDNIDVDDKEIAFSDVLSL